MRKDQRLQKVELETGKLANIREDKNWCGYDQLIDNARMMLNCLHKHDVYVKNEANGAIHRLTKKAFSLMDE